MQVKGWDELQRYFFFLVFFFVTITVIRREDVSLTDCNSTGVMVFLDSPSLLGIV